MTCRRKRKDIKKEREREDENDDDDDESVVRKINFVNDCCSCLL